MEYLVKSTEEKNTRICGVNLCPVNFVCAVVACGTNFSACVANACGLRI